MLTAVLAAPHRVLHSGRTLPLSRQLALFRLANALNRHIFSRPFFLPFCSLVRVKTLLNRGKRDTILVPLGYFAFRLSPDCDVSFRLSPIEFLLTGLCRS